MTKGHSDGALMQTFAMIVLQKAPNVIPSSLQINHIWSTVRPDSEKKAGMLSWVEGEGHADEGGA